MDWNTRQLRQWAADFFAEPDANTIDPVDALRPELAGLRIYDEPLFGVAAADDALFTTLRQPEVVHPEAMLPGDWLPGARSVISFFLPFSEPVRRSNRERTGKASDEWLHARIEGQTILVNFGLYLCRQLDAAGETAVFPTTDPRFRLLTPYASNWSERHAAYIAGLGTFGLSRGLITEKGMAGRFGSIVTGAGFPATARKYTGAFDYCILCGKCARNCPANAFDLSKGVAGAKLQDVCGAYVAASYLPLQGVHQRVRYGCGKCQVDIPCESAIPVLSPR